MSITGAWQEALRTHIPEHDGEVIGLLDAIVSGAQDALSGNLVGVYVRGSLATGDFIPDTSDIDVLAATDRTVSAEEFAALAAMHARTRALPNPYSNRVEMAYIDRAALRRFSPGLHHPTLYQGEEFGWREHGCNWILERWTLRQRGVTLVGPEPGTLIDHISSYELCAAVRARLRDWADWADQPGDPDWLLPLAHKAYVVETMCRALCLLAEKEIQSKSCAVAWALAALPEPWRSTVERSRRWRTDNSPPGPHIVAEVMRFVRWAATDGPRPDMPAVR